MVHCIVETVETQPVDRCAAKGVTKGATKKGVTRGTTKGAAKNGGRENVIGFWVFSVRLCCLYANR
jgi:hypothetical protein